MATTQNTYTGNGSNTAYSFTFPYLETTDIKVSLNAVDTTAYTLSNATTVSFTTAPASGVAIRIYRNTDTDNLKASFFPGSAIKASDLNNNFTQNLYVTQESEFDVNTASTAAAAAQTAANTAINTANGAVTTANTAVTTANNAVTTANGAVTTANGAVTTANTADNNATTALNTANSANATANATAVAVANAGFFTPVAAVAGIPSSPANQDRIEIVNSTGIESFSPLSGLPAGFVGATGLTVRLEYSTSGSTWTWSQYFANDPENRYLTDYLPVVKGDGTSSGQVGKITLNCSNNNHGVSIQSPPHSAGATYTLTLPNDTGSAGQALTTNGSGVLSFATVDSAFIETPQTITTSKVIAANTNAGMMGPTVSINSGSTITVGANSLLTVLK